MKIIVCGGRDYDDRERVFDYLDRLHVKIGITRVIEGGARGADRLGREWARARNICVQTVPANWDQHGKRAGWLRNVAMADLKPDMVVAFPGGIGTDMMVKIAIARRIPGARVRA